MVRLKEYLTVSMTEQNCVDQMVRLKEYLTVSMTEAGLVDQMVRLTEYLKEVNLALMKVNLMV